MLKNLEVFTILENELRDNFNRTGLDYSLINGEIKDAKLSNKVRDVGLLLHQ